MPALSHIHSVEQEITERTEGWEWRQVELLMGRGDSLKDARTGAAAGSHLPLSALCFLRFLLFASASLQLSGHVFIAGDP